VNRGQGQRDATQIERGLDFLVHAVICARSARNFGIVSIFSA